MVSDVRQHRWQRACKRGLDILFSLVALLLTLPLQVVLLLWVWFATGRPLFYKETRLGLFGKPFEIYKLRTLESGTSTHSSVAVDSDSRITAPGRVLRRSRFDELPQLWLVLTGSMSLIGPRPLPPKHAATARPFCVKKIQSMRPGCAGAAALDFIADDEVLAQWVEKHGDAQPEQLYLSTILPQKLAVELDYVKNWSLLLDCQIFIRTIALLLFGMGRDASRARVKNILDHSF
jgi:lipopolysaccharide/colanic/teichoic acid biosynthesis glycosyltransferase